MSSSYFQIIIDTTYNNLTSSISSSALTKGAWYKITDYQTIHLIPNTSQINSASIEPLLVFAEDVNKISTHVFSQAYPQDLIEYDYTKNLAEDSSTPRPGLITWRKDTALDVDAFYDWRTYLFARWQIDPSGINGSGSPYTWSATPAFAYIRSDLAISGTDGKLYLNLTGVNVTDPSTDNANWALLLDIATHPYLFPLGSGYCIVANGVVLLSSPYQTYLTFNGYYQDVHLNVGSLDNVFLGDCGAINIGVLSISNTFVNFVFSESGAYFYYNIFDVNCLGNNFNTSCHNNVFGSNSGGNNFVTDCHDNAFGTGFNDNTLDSSCLINVFGNNCSSNKFGYNCYNNSFSYNVTGTVFGDNCNNNYIGEMSSGNIFGDNCNSNTLGTYNGNNIFGYNDYSNIFGDSCSSNICGCNVSNVMLGSGSLFNQFGIACDTISLPINSLYNNFLATISNMDLSTMGSPPQNVNFDSGLYNFTGVGFSTATVIPGAYSKFIYIDKTLGIRMRHWDSDVNIITAANV